jgi:hypothetical protein
MSIVELPANERRRRLDGGMLERIAKGILAESIVALPVPFHPVWQKPVARFSRLIVKGKFTIFYHCQGARLPSAGFETITVSRAFDKAVRGKPPSVAGAQTMQHILWPAEGWFRLHQPVTSEQLA